MIKTVKGDLLTARGYIVHGCNAQGVMGSGVAKQIRAKWPKAYEHYKDRAVLGCNSYYKCDDETVIVNAVTQEYYGNDKFVYVDYRAMKDCFMKLALVIPMHDIPRVVNFPLIGCGLAGGKWEIVSKIIDEAIPDSIEKVLWLR